MSFWSILLKVPAASKSSRHLFLTLEESRAWGIQNSNFELGLALGWWNNFTELALEEQAAHKCKECHFAFSARQPYFYFFGFQVMVMFQTPKSLTNYSFFMYKTRKEKSHGPYLSAACGAVAVISHHYCPCWSETKKSLLRLLLEWLLSWITLRAAIIVYNWNLGQTLLEIGFWVAKETLNISKAGQGYNSTISAYYILHIICEYIQSSLNFCIVCFGIFFAYY